MYIYIIIILFIQTPIFSDILDNIRSCYDYTSMKWRRLYVWKKVEVEVEGEDEDEEKEDKSVIKILGRVGR